MSKNNNVQPSSWQLSHVRVLEIEECLKVVFTRNMNIYQSILTLSWQNYIPERGK